MKIYRVLFVLYFIFITNKGQAQLTTDVAHWLNESDLTISVRLNQYDYERYNLLTNQVKHPLSNKTQNIDFQESKWLVTTAVSRSQNHSGAVDFAVTFRCTSGELPQGSVAIDVEAQKWSVKNYVLLPSVAYNGNRYEWRRLRYSPKLYEVQDIGVDKPIIVSDIPKLNTYGVSRLQDRSGSLATPAMGFRSDSLKKGVWILTEQGNNLGDYGFSVEETRNRDKATFSITAPVVREQFNYIICDNHNPSWDIPKHFKKGDETTIYFRIYTFETPSVQSLFDKFSEVRKDFSQSKNPHNTLPFSACMGLLEEKFNTKNFENQYGYYSVGFRENFLQDWQIGWTGGMISTYPLLFAGNEQTQKNVCRNFDWLFPNGISPSGFYYDSGAKGTLWYGGDIRKPQTKNWHLIRKSGDAVFYILKQFDLMQKRGIEVKPIWREGNQKVCDAFVKLWQKQHQLGQFVDSQTGEIAVGGSSSGAIVPAALALAAQFYQKSNYLDVAKALADSLNENFVKKGISCGGPGDALQNFDSESAYALVESFVTLYEVTQDKKWLAIAQNATRQLATWVVSYDFKFPKNTLFERYNIHTTGAVYANTQNKHAAPALCTFSGLGLFKLFRYANDTFALQLLYDIAHNMPQYLPHPKKPMGDIAFGHLSERVNMNDWEGLDQIGEVARLSTWAETSLMLTATEIPSLYVQPDKGFFVMFDNIEVKKVENTEGGLSIEIYNSTPVDAVLSILEEKSALSSKIWQHNSLVDTQKTTLKSGETKVLTFKK